MGHDHVLLDSFQLIVSPVILPLILSPNFAPPHFAARGIPKNTPHGTMDGHTAYIYMLSVYQFRMELFSFSLYTKHTLLHGLIFFVKYGKG
jgi:hypothetical protein